MVFGGQYFYNQSVTKQLVAFAACFNNMAIERTDSSGNVTEKLVVPIQFAERDKMIARIEANPTADRPFSVNMPAMSFELVNMQYDSGRKISSLSRRVKSNPDDKNTVKVQYEPSPWNFYFNLYIYAKNMEDGHKLLEQVVAFFTPDYTISVEFNNAMGQTRDVPIVLQTAQFKSENTEDFKERRMLIWTCNFTMHGWIFGPVKTKYVIKDIIINMKLDDTVATKDAPAPDIDTVANTAPIASITTIVPGRDANGNPTTNTSITVPWSQISIDDDYAYIVQYTAQGESK